MNDAVVQHSNTLEKEKKNFVNTMHKKKQNIEMWHRVLKYSRLCIVSHHTLFFMKLKAKAVAEKEDEENKRQIDLSARLSKKNEWYV